MTEPEVQTADEVKKEEAVMDNKTCKSCKHWKEPPTEGHRSYIRHRYTRPPDQDTGKPMVLPFEVRVCEHPSKTFCERPVEANGFGVADGSEYVAILLTAEDFGCVRHEAE